MSFTYIDAVAHGFTTGDKIAFSNLEGGQGIIEGDPYYVIASGLTADIFQFSETLGGTAFAFDTTITAGSVVAWATYTEAADGVQDPPTALDDPGQPALTSDVTTGTVRIVVTIPTVTDPRIRHTEFQITDEYSIPASAPDAPVYTNATTQQLLPGVSTFSVRAHPNTIYSARIRNVDVYGNTSAWSVAFFGPTANITTIDGLDSLLSAFLDHTIDTNEITPLAITADLLESTMVLTNQLIAGDPAAQHVEMDLDGIRLVDAADVVVVNIPTDALQPVTVAGNIVAGTLVSTSSAEFRTAASVPVGAVLTAQAGVAAPTGGPTLAQGWETPLSLTATHDPWWGLEYTAAGAAGGATKVIYCGTSDNTTTQWYVQEFLASTGALNRTITLPVNAQYNGCAVLGTNLYVHAVLSGVTKVYKYAISTFTLTTTYSPTPPVTAGATGAIASDGTNLYIVQAGSPMKFTKYDTSLVVVSGPTSTGVNGDPFDAKAGSFDLGAFRLLLTDQSGGTTQVRSFNSAGTEQTNEVFPTWNTLGFLYGDVDGTGARFWSCNSMDAAANTLLLTKHTNWKWTTASSKYFVGYAWYDSVGTTHETAISPRGGITMGRRKRLSITTAAIPVGAAGVDDPNSVRIYILPNATDPGAGALKLQVTDSATQRYLTDYNAAGTLDGIGTVFPPGTAGELKSATTPGWSLKGDGTAVVPSFIQSGTVSVTLSAAANAQVTVTFANAFAGAPRVVATTTTGTSTYIANVNTITSSNFVVNVFHRAGTSTSVTITVNWIAIYGQG